eukprot:1145922-Pelagomonas_calceolata.AAC.10
MDIFGAAGTIEQAQQPNYLAEGNHTQALLTTMKQLEAHLKCNAKLPYTLLKSDVLAQGLPW